MKNLIKQHNARVLKNQEHSEKRSCNCRGKDNCPLDGKCLHKCIVYQANECKEYFGTAEGEFKLHYNNHTMSFRHKKCVNDTELSKYFWKLNEENTDYNLQWSIKAYGFLYKCGTRNYDQKKLLNKWKGLVFICTHRNKFLLSSIK